MVPRAGVEPARPCGHYALNVARLPFRHLGNSQFNTNRLTSIDPQSIQRIPIDDPLDLVLRYHRKIVVFRKLAQPA